VPSKDYFKVPVEEIGEIDAVMTVVGGKIGYAEKLFAQSEQK
jgi:predicted amidohydrolase YtcJ